MQSNQNESVHDAKAVKPQKDKIIGLSTRLADGTVASGWKIIATEFGYHLFNIITILLLLIIVACNWSDASKGQVLEVAWIIKSFSIYGFFLAFWAGWHQRLFANTAYFTGLLLLYFLILQLLSNAMYGSMAQLAIICLFQFCFLALVLALATMFCQNRGISPISSITNNQYQ
ncbi:hypothetical protein [Acinetobacter sp. YH12153]|uniref:hypothetical protein n=1 Tax=Acinetobacter sp. YH12153 TaxID=2601133 RepID=UPI0015D1066F|nr:hypothetical protein [Acinetobacter sp. YH12153]